MDKILVVGHENSHYKDIEQILFSYGMAQAIPSHIYQMTPIELGLRLLSQVSTDQCYTINNNPYNPKKPKKIWDNLIFDLLFANSNQPLWGWADKDAISLLEYWADFDENIVFILIYDKPDNTIKSLLKACNNNINILDSNTIQIKIEDWLNYNQSLLAFHEKYQKRCLLINGQQSIISINNFIKLIIRKFSLSEKNLLNFPDAAYDAAENKKTSNNTNLSQYFLDEEIIDYFTQQILKKHNNALDFFAKIQNFSDIPLSKNNTLTHEKATLDILSKTILQQENLLILKNELSQHQETINKINKTAIENEKLWRQKLLQSKYKHQKEKQNLKKQLQDCQSDNYIITTQLHQTQEKFEEFYLENQKIKNIIEEQKKQIEILTKPKLNKNITESDSSFKQQHEQPLHLDINDIKWENKLLITQLYQIQEELEKYYLENKKLTNKLNKINSTKKEPSLYGAADRIKQDLPYRLGAIMVNQSKTLRGVINLPFSLLSEYHNFKNNQKNLPQINRYLDANEAEKVKKHLSYRLGKVLVDSINSPKNIFILPIRIGREIINFKKNRDYL